jgi:hypothetical protein
MAKDWYANAEDYWHELPGTDYLSREENGELYPIFLDYLNDVNSGWIPMDSLNYRELAEEFGWSDEDFDWEAFRDWYNNQ